MKKLYTLLVALVITASTFAQAPEKMSYQAVVRDSGANLVSGQQVGMQISILEGTTPVYVETHTPTTNANGLVSIEIGMGSVVSGDFTTIDWSTGSYFIKTETDPTGPSDGISYTITGTSELLSVPYALQAKNGIPAGGAIGQVLRINSNGIPEWVDIDGADFDGDGFTIAGGDCNDNDASAYPEATEIYGDGLDNDCDGDIDEAEIGDIIEGGVVFWVDPADNTRGLVCAAVQPSSGIRWYNGSAGYTNADGLTIGTGSANTDIIIAAYGAIETSYAAGLARDYDGGGFDDWFLPSKDELNEMYLNKTALEAADGFTAFSGNYWSSTDFNFNNAWRQSFSTGVQDNIGKAFSPNVRAVRAF